MNLKLNGKNYPILVGKNKVSELEKFVRKNHFRKLYLLSDQDLTRARKQLKALFSKINGKSDPKYKVEFHEIAVTAGESLKDIQSVYPIYGELLKGKADRDSLLIALGGGSIGDTAGFVASTYLRGIAWVGIPTTLLAQVDSSVGGKTGINHEVGKNLIGTFHQPSLVVCDTQFLSTLSKREIASGIGEIVKYAITFDAKFFQYLEQNLDLLLKLDPGVTEKCIESSLQFKVKAVEADELDRTGVREVLNFGHTFGHALETITDYQIYQHGEAVAWGMKFATSLSVVRGHLNDKHAAVIESLLARIPLPPLPKKLNADAIFAAMKRDKKASQNQIRFVLLKRIGHTISDKNVTETDLKNAFQRMMR